MKKAHTSYYKAISSVPTKTLKSSLMSLQKWSVKLNFIHEMILKNQNVWWITKSKV